MRTRPLEERIECHILAMHPTRLLIHPSDIMDKRGTYAFKKLGRIIKKYGMDVKVIGEAYVWGEKDLEWLM